MIPSPEEMVTIEKIVVQQCHALARRWNACGEDAVGEVFLKVYANLQSFDHLQKPEHYLRKTAHHEARRYFQKEKEALLPALGDSVAYHDTSALALLVKAEDQQRLRKALSELPSDQRKALLVRAGAQDLDTEGDNLPKSIRRLARQCGCSPQHLCNLANRAERWLRRQLC